MANAQTRPWESHGRTAGLAGTSAANSAQAHFGYAPRMASVRVDPSRVHEFENEQSFYVWLRKHWDQEPEVWIKIHKLRSGLASITPAQAIDAALCWGWIDGIRVSFDDKSFLQRYTPRGKKSIWSKINVANVERLIKGRKMQPSGLAQVAAAKADGRWEKAYRYQHLRSAAGSGRDSRRAQGGRDVRDTLGAEPLFVDLSYPRHEDRGRAKEADRQLRRDARQRRDHPSQRQTESTLNSDSVTRSTRFRLSGRRATYPAPESYPYAESR